MIWVWGSPGGGSQSGGVFGFLTNFDGPWTPIQWVKILAQTFFGNFALKKNILDLETGVSVDGVRKRVDLAFLVVSL